MSDNTKYFLVHLPACLIFALIAAAAAALFKATSDYTTYHTALKVYSIGWFATCLLSFYCGLLVVPRSLGIFFSFAGLVAFAIICAMDTGFLTWHPLMGQMIQTLPALFFIAAWAVISLASYKSENRKIRLSSWLWLTIFVLLLSSWVTFHYTQRQLLKQRNACLIEGRNQTLRIVEALNTHKETHGSYPPSLADAGIGPEQTTLTMTAKHIKYTLVDTGYTLTFADPVPSGQTALFSYDTAQDGWFGIDPEDALVVAPSHTFFGMLRQRRNLIF